MASTNQTSPSLHPWDTWEGPALEEPIRASFRGCVYYFHDRRSAWNETFSLKYPGHLAYHLSMIEARRAIEKRRVQGSQWKIEELPALVLEGDVHALVVTEINTRSPLSDFTNLIPDSWTLEAAANLLNSRRKNRTSRFITPKGTLKPQDPPSRRYSSRSVGPKDRYMLSWVGEPLDVDEQPLQLIIARWNRALRELEGKDASSCGPGCKQ
ncbi:hypothetical protein GETHED_03400 [Geothrix edaphica]|uniref:Uncharacterized protein n=1 Tax=Geothrix edaphica TaxID=2927976 RepID=A0ABQ5PV14_9BACT|nr:hypothetical protein GETHED_03400 [Geothrix edaphica]